MTGLEILFITNLIVLIVMWGWFIFMGFNTSRTWGVSLTLLFPISPFVFAYRFERKTRKVIYYFTIILIMFAALNGWIYFATIDFFDNFSHKLTKLVPKFEKTEKVKPKLNLPKPTPIPEPLAVIPEANLDEIKKQAKPIQNHSYKTVHIDSAHNYIGKKVIISTAIVVHHGILLSVGIGQVEIKKDLAGGSTIMGIPKNKIEKFEVYL